MDNAFATSLHTQVAAIIANAASSSTAFLSAISPAIVIVCVVTFSLFILAVVIGFFETRDYNAAIERARSVVSDASDLFEEMDSPSSIAGDDVMEEFLGPVPADENPWLRSH